MSDLASAAGRERDPVVSMLVGQALDDLESERIDAATAFRLVAERAWTEGHRAGLNAGGFLQPPPAPRTATRTDEVNLENQG
jgi:hypothetical protein